MSERASGLGPGRASAAAAAQLSPAFPARAPWGTAGHLRAWQAAALKTYEASHSPDFLAVATPGAGKTTFALRVAVDLIGRGVVDKVTVVCPTEHLKSQWADAAARVGIHIDPAFSNTQGRAGDHFDGVAVTYAQVAANPAVHELRTRSRHTLVILDEVHHAGDALSWGDAVAKAFGQATRRLALTGTPFRSDTNPIPFVRYVADENGVKHSQADFTYGYGDALRDGVVRPVLFMSYSGQMAWRDNAGEQYTARLGEPLTKDLMKQAWRTALDPKGEWIPAVLQAANQRLDEVRRTIPDAGGLVIAADQQTARAYAAHLRRITGRPATVVLSDDADASERIDAFRQSTDRWMVAVRMVSEGVDVPRLAVGVYATNTATQLFFAQAVGRFVRARRRGENATIFVPSVIPLLDLAGQMEVERDHVLSRKLHGDHDDLDGVHHPEDALVAQANRAEQASSDLLPGFEALDAQAEFDSVLFDGSQWGSQAEVGSVEEQEFLGIPGLLDPDQVTTLLRARQAEQVKQQKRSRDAKALRDENAGLSDHRQRKARRQELQHLVSAWARRSGETHATIHAKLRNRCGGPEVARATTQQLEARIALLREWFVGR